MERSGFCFFPLSSTVCCRRPRELNLPSPTSPATEPPQLQSAGRSLPSHPSATLIFILSHPSPTRASGRCLRSQCFSNSIRFMRLLLKLLIRSRRHTNLWVRVSSSLRRFNYTSRPLSLGIFLYFLTLPSKDVPTHSQLEYLHRFPYILNINVFTAP